MPSDEFFEDFKENLGKSDLDKTKIAIIVGASEALKRKTKNFRKSDEEVIQEIVDDLEKLIDKIDF